MSRNLVFGEAAKNVTMKLYSWEKEDVKTYIKNLRKNKKKELENDERHLKSKG